MHVDSHLSAGCHLQSIDNTADTVGPSHQSACSGIASVQIVELADASALWSVLLRKLRYGEGNDGSTSGSWDAQSIKCDDGRVGCRAICRVADRGREGQRLARFRESDGKVGRREGRRHPVGARWLGSEFVALEEGAYFLLAALPVLLVLDIGTVDELEWVRQLRVRVKG